MKKYLFLFFTLIISDHIISFGQYKPFSSYNGDTLSYLQENFIKNKSFYVGKPINNLLNNLEFSVKSYIPSFSGYNTELITDIDLSFFGSGESRYLLLSKDIRYYELGITLQTPVMSDSIPKLADHYPDEDWVSEVKALFQNRIIKNIYLYYSNQCAIIRGIKQCEVCDQGSVNYDAFECAISYCERESANYDPVRCARSLCDPRSPMYDEEKCTQGRCDYESPNFNDTICARLICDGIEEYVIIADPGGNEYYCDSCYCHPESPIYNAEKCKKRRVDLMKNRYTEMKAILTPEQYEKYREWMGIDRISLIEKNKLKGDSLRRKK